MSKTAYPESHLESYQARQDHIIANLEKAYWVLIAYGVLMTVAVVILAVMVTRKTMVYQTIRGAEQSGYVSVETAQDYARDFLRWMHDFDYNNISERAPHLLRKVCPSVPNAFHIELEKERGRVVQNLSTQRLQIRGLRLQSTNSRQFVFLADVTIQSSLLREQKTEYQQVYKVVVQQDINNDGTLSLCINSHERLTSQQRSM